MTFPQRIAATILITVGALILYLMFALFNSLAPTVAFADLAEKVKSVRTLVYTSTVTLPGKPAQTWRTLFAEPNHMRMEYANAVSISDGKSTLALDPKTKTAWRIEHGPVSMPMPQINMIEGFRKMGQTKGEPVGEKVIDGVKTTGFRVKIGGPIMTIWADRKTALPVRVESVIHTPEGDIATVMDHFQLDPVLDESLFSMDVPAGYALAPEKLEMPKSFKPEDIVADCLRVYTKMSGGSFPASLTDPNAFKKVDYTKLSKQEQLNFGGKLGGMFGVVFALKDYGYAGNDVKLGDKDKVIFWYKPAKSKTYRAVFGDLHVGDVTEDQLPATQPSKPSSK